MPATCARAQLDTVAGLESAQQGEEGRVQWGRQGPVWAAFALCVLGGLGFQVMFLSLLAKLYKVRAYMWQLCFFFA